MSELRMRPLDRYRASLLGIVSLVTVVSGCVYPATEVFVVVDTDFAPSRPLQVVASVHRGGSSTAVSHSWIRGDASQFDGGGPIEFPASFAIVPAEGASRDEAVELEIEARLAAIQGEPEATTRRRARFRFTPRQPTVVRIFLSSICAAQATGCTTATGAACTVSQVCEDRGQTCGDDGSCVAPEIDPMPTNGDVVLRPDGSAARDASDDADDRMDGLDTPATVDATDTLDAEDAIDTGETGPDVIDPANLDPPRFVAPVSGSNVTGDHVPPFVLEPAPGTNGAFVEVCPERSCASYAVRIDARTSPVISSRALTPGTWFWRAVGAVDGVAGTHYGPTWEFHIGRRPVTSQTWWGTRLDVNGDGFDDVVLGHPTVSSDRGQVAVHLGSPSGVLPTGNVGIDGEATNISLGQEVSAAGDVDGDGFVDLAVTALQSTDRVRIFRGGASGVITPAQWVLRMPESSANGFGGTLAAAGDVNGDGYADLAIGAPTGDSNSGIVYVYNGSAAGLGSMPSATIRAPATGGQFGWVIASADVNGDHFSDLLVGAGAVDAGVGRLYVFHGSASGIGITPVSELSGRGVPGGAFGIVLDAAGDMNGDGFADIATSAYGESGGQVYTYIGSASGVQPTFGTTVIGVAGTGRFGTMMAGDGDIDGDGFGDFVTSDPGTDRALVFRGGAMPNGVMTPAWMTISAPPGGNGGFGNLGTGGGDVDRDGFDDFVVVTNGGVNFQAYLFRGGATLSTTPAVTFMPLGTGDVVSAVGM